MTPRIVIRHADGTRQIVGLASDSFLLRAHQGLEEAVFSRGAVVAAAVERVAPSYLLYRVKA